MTATIPFKYYNDVAVCDPHIDQESESSIVDATIMVDATTQKVVEKLEHFRLDGIKYSCDYVLFIESLNCYVHFGPLIDYYDAYDGYGEPYSGTEYTSYGTIPNVKCRSFIERQMIRTQSSSFRTLMLRMSVITYAHFAYKELQIYAQKCRKQVPVILDDFLIKDLIAIVVSYCEEIEYANIQNSKKRKREQLTSILG
jgi:hypothetical protein